MNATPAPYPRLVADIGGTNARFALVEAPGAAPTHLRALRCAEHSGRRPRCAPGWRTPAPACPLTPPSASPRRSTADGVAMTNHPWRFSIGALCGALGLRRLTVVNDFTALALALPALGDGDLVRVGGGEPRAGAARALIGAGTGLGVSGLLPVPGGWVPLQGEGGHVTLPASCTREAAVVAWLAARHGHVSAERVLSGPGLVVLHDTLRALDGEARVERTPAEISERALAGGCRHCVEALELFCALLGTVAGDVALTLGARGGLYIGGGIVPRLGDFFLRSAFRERFVAKGRFRPWLERIPIWVVVAPHAALTGASAALDSAIELGFTTLAEPRGHVSP
jgi:glucokinase